MADHLASDDEHAIALARSVVRNLNIKKEVSLQVEEPAPPLYNPEDMYGIVGTNLQQSFEVRDVIARLVDGSRFDEFKALYGAFFGWLVLFTKTSLALAQRERRRQYYSTCTSVT